MTLQKLLVINPNSSESMTAGLDTLIASLGASSVFDITTFTAPSSSPPSINNAEDLIQSTSVVIPALVPLLEHYDAFVLACYSVHDLGARLRDLLPAHKKPFVMGIFEASVMMSRNLLQQNRFGSRGNDALHSFGIISTGKFWEKHLSDGVHEILGSDGDGSKDVFGGVETTGLSAAELHEMPPDVVKEKTIAAVKRLLNSGATSRCKVICLGCAGMSGMDSIVREAAVEQWGKQAASELFIIDGVKAAILLLEGMLRMVIS